MNSQVCCWCSRRAEDFYMDDGIKEPICFPHKEVIEKARKEQWINTKEFFEVMTKITKQDGSAALNRRYTLYTQEALHNKTYMYVKQKFPALVKVLRVRMVANGTKIQLRVRLVNEATTKAHWVDEKSLLRNSRRTPFIYDQKVYEIKEGEYIK